ncbi:Uncharacterised protein [Mycobacterium tuberculosis]|uniref:Uncharacterized protein n=1 Tax=Mycobacterium tuberculosis TaxID=1773 RepID=A0A655JFN2_MYCTX|nr:Uncharacterised protein [Mycobacterium tuberculosis]COW85288.1 Uncharacterised protein [Mycobacterium tuberculosis]
MVECSVGARHDSGAVAVAATGFGFHRTGKLCFEQFQAADASCPVVVRPPGQLARRGLDATVADLLPGRIAHPVLGPVSTSALLI